MHQNNTLAETDVPLIHVHDLKRPSVRHEWGVAPCDWQKRSVALWVMQNANGDDVGRVSYTPSFRKRFAWEVVLKWDGRRRMGWEQTRDLAQQRVLETLAEWNIPACWIPTMPLPRIPFSTSTYTLSDKRWLCYLRQCDDLCPWCNPREWD